MNVDQLQTPALIIDADIMKKNMKKMNSLLPKGTELRPHYKSHKCVALAHMQMKAGAKGMCCSKLAEAEDLIDAGFEDVLIANEVVSPAQIQRVAQLAKCCKLAVCADDAENIDALQAAAKFNGSTINVLVEYNVGMNRCGVNTKSEFLKLAKKIDSASNLKFMGIQAYCGNLAHEYDLKLKKKLSEETEEKLKELKAYVESKGIKVKEVSGVSTGTSNLRKAGTVYTEVQAGSYLFMDTSYMPTGAPFRNSLFMLTSVISAGKGRLVLDAGAKSMGMDQEMPEAVGFPKAEIDVNEEHTKLFAEHSLKIGDKVKLIPGHCCTTMNLQNFVYLVSGDKVIDKIPVTSKGK